MNKKIISLICAATGVCILSTAAIAGYQSPNGYDELKKSILSTIDYTNCTINSVSTIDVDGTEMLYVESLMEDDVDNSIYHTKTTSKSLGSDDYINESYEYGGYYYDLVKDEDDYYYYKYKYDFQYSKPNLWGIEDEDRKTADKIIKFMETAADTVVGDLRNNFVCTGENADYTSYSITLDSVQVPELINAGLSMLFSLENSLYSDDTVYDSYDDSGYYFLLMGDDPILDNVELNYDINKNGTFRSGSMKVVFKGNSHTMTSTFDCEFSNIGSTSIKTLEEQGATNIRQVQ